MEAKSDYKTLEPEILDNIQSFSGSPEEMTPSERIISGGQTLQRTQTAYTTAVAVQKPRSFTRFVNNCMEEAKLAGSAFYYRWEVYDKEKKKKVPIEGESIDMSMCLARNFGNDVVDVEVTENASHYLFKGVFIDLETGFTAPRMFRQRKGQKVSGKMDADRQEDIVFQIGQSKAIRNAIVRAMPKWLRDQMIEAAKDAELSKIKPENIHLARSKVMDFFSKYGISQDRIETERNKIADEWGPEDIVDLRGMATALKEGRISPDELFPKETEVAQDAPGEEKPESEGEGTEDWKCPHCPFQGTSERGLKKHITQQHPQNPPAEEVEDLTVEEMTEEEFLRVCKGYEDELGLPKFNLVLMAPPFLSKDRKDIAPDQWHGFLQACSRKLDEINAQG